MDGGTLEVVCCDWNADIFVNIVPKEFLMQTCDWKYIWNYTYSIFNHIVEHRYCWTWHTIERIIINREHESNNRKEIFNTDFCFVTKNVQLHLLCFSLFRLLNVVVFHVFLCNICNVIYFCRTYKYNNIME